MYTDYTWNPQIPSDTRQRIHIYLIIEEHHNYINQKDITEIYYHARIKLRSELNYDE